MAEEVQMTKDAKTMLGDPKKALIAMAIPIVISNFIQSANNIIDTFWLTSIGVDAQAAVSVIFPIFFIVIGLGNGIAVGVSQALARRVGANNKIEANHVAEQAIILSLIISIFLTVVFLIFSEEIIFAGGGSSNMDACMAYAIPIFLGFPVIILSDIFSGLLRSEGSSKRAMYIMVLGAGLNIILDPIFIFVLDMGISGAAWATTIAMIVPMFLVVYWYYLKKDTYVHPTFKGFSFDKALIMDILRVGIPASLEMVLLSLMMMVMNLIIEGVGSVDGVAIYGNCWKLMDLFFMPTLAIGFAVVPLCAAAIGAKDYQRVRSIYHLALKYGILISIGITVVLLLFSEFLVIPFSYSEETLHLRSQMVTMLMICSLMMPFGPLGYTSSGYFQGMGWGLKSLSIILVLNLLRIPICIAMASIYGTLESIWWGVVAAETIGSLYGGVLGFYSIHKLVTGGYPKYPLSE
ncbi:MAG: MATE family efflux transporter [Thermoplasmata archaeon]|nr:MATE family efflux transporter [Thermoplasmata archaeon]